MKILVTGGAGFIGSNFIRYFLKKYPDSEIINLDKLTYSGNLENLREIEKNPNYTFVKGDIADREVVENIFSSHKPNMLINFAAETHVDRSISGPADFIKTDIYGTFILLECAKNYGLDLFIQISTDEVYGFIEKESATENYPLMPTNPYSASKTGADRLCYSYFATFGMPVIITRASNNFGAYQYPEKIIPLFITNAIENNPLPLYGDGLQIRDWLFVDDHCKAIDFLIKNGKFGEVYNIGGGNLLTNLDLTKLILEHLKKPHTLIKHVEDRPGHDRRYSLSIKKLAKLGWTPETNFKDAIKETVSWYQDNLSWWQKIKNGEFKEYYKKQYQI